MQYESDIVNTGGIYTLNVIFNCLLDDIFSLVQGEATEEEIKAI